MTEIPFLGIFSVKNRNCQFKLKFGSSTDSNMQNSMVMFTFSGFYRKYSFWVNLVQKLKTQCKLKFGTWTKSNVQNSMVVFRYEKMSRFLFDRDDIGTV